MNIVIMSSSMFFFFFFKQKTAYEIKECDWSSDVCSSDLRHLLAVDDFKSLKIVSPSDFIKKYLK